MKQFGLALGLIAPPKIKVKPNASNELQVAEVVTSLNEGVVNGFEELIPLSFKRTGAFHFPYKEDNADLELAQNSDKRLRYIWWRAIRLNYRRRNDLKALLAEARSLDLRTVQPVAA